MIYSFFQNFVSFVFVALSELSYKNFVPLEFLRDT
jgi:hypothetical protein